MTDYDFSQLRRLDFSLLLVFSEAMRHRKLSAVAAVLALTPSAVSHSLKRLRDVFGDELFVRRPHGVEPTARALALAPRVRSVIEAAQHALAKDAPFDSATAQCDLRIASSDLHTTILAPPLIALVTRSAPGVRLAFLSAVRGAALEALRSGDADIAVGLFGAAGQEFDRSQVFTDQYALVMRKDDPRARRRMSLPAYLDCRHVLVSYNGDFEGVVDTALRERSLQRRVVVVVPSFLSAMAAVARSDLVAAVPARIARHYAPTFGLVRRNLPLEIRPLEISVLWHRRRRSDPAVSWLIDVACSLLRK